MNINKETLERLLLMIGQVEDAADSLSVYVREVIREIEILLKSEE